MCGVWWGWLSDEDPRRASRLRRSRRSPGDLRTGASWCHTLACGDFGERRKSYGRRGLARSLQRSGGWIVRGRWIFNRCRAGCFCVYKPGWLLPLQMAKRVSERASRGGERRNTAVSVQRIRGGGLELPSGSVWAR